MIKSRLLRDVLDLSIESDNRSDFLSQQVPFLTEGYFEHTKVGLYVYFKHEDEITPFKVNTEYCSLDIEGTPVDSLESLEMKNLTLNIHADVTVHLLNGLIECIEIFNKNGLVYPNVEPINYTLKSHSTQSCLIR